MKDWQSLAHVKWECKYHVVILPKYRRKVLYGRLRREIGRIVRDLCRQKGIGLEEGKAMPDHIHLLLVADPSADPLLSAHRQNGSHRDQSHHHGLFARELKPPRNQESEDDQNNPRTDSEYPKVFRARGLAHVSADSIGFPPESRMLGAIYTLCEVFIKGAGKWGSINHH